MRRWRKFLAVENNPSHSSSPSNKKKKERKTSKGAEEIRKKKNKNTLQTLGLGLLFTHNGEAKS